MTTQFELAMDKIIAATDVHISTITATQVEVATGTKHYKLEVPTEDRAKFIGIISDILPQICQSLPLQHQLSEADLNLITPYVDGLIGIGVLFKVDVTIETEPDRRLFTFLARRSQTPGSAYSNARKQKFCIHGPPEIEDAWAPLFKEQGLTLSESPKEGIAIEVFFDGPQLLSCAVDQHAARQEWVPVLFTQSRVTIGPWVSPGQTACPACNPPYEPESESLPLLSRSSWLTFQPGTLGWVGGLLAHQALRVVAPIGPHHPWGNITHLDALRYDQRYHAVWKNPFCETCGAARRSQQVWIEHS